MLYCNLIGRLFLVAPVMFSSCNFRFLGNSFLECHILVGEYPYSSVPYCGGCCGCCCFDIMESDGSDISSDGSDISVVQEEYSGEEEEVEAREGTEEEADEVNKIYSLLFCFVLFCFLFFSHTDTHTKKKIVKYETLHFVMGQVRTHSLLIFGQTPITSKAILLTSTASERGLVCVV